MNPIQFIFALVRIYLPLPPEFKTEVDQTYAEGMDEWRQIDENGKGMDSKVKRFASNWKFKTLLLFMILPVGRWVQSVGKPKEDEDKEFKELLKQLKED